LVVRQRVIARKQLSPWPTLECIATSPPIADHRSSALLGHLARIMRMRAETALTPLGLRPRHLVALTILRDHGNSTQQALAAALQIDRTNLVGLLNDLETDGLVERRRSSEDRRRHLVDLTPVGAQRLAEAECALAAAEDDVLGALGPDERETLYRLLQQATLGQVADCAGAANEPPTAHDALSCGAAVTDDDGPPA
jgi:DNA-binding MarR family transcriptional regulator